MRGEWLRLQRGGGPHDCHGAPPGAAALDALPAGGLELGPAEDRRACRVERRAVGVVADAPRAGGVDHRDTSVSELGIWPVTLYRYVGPSGPVA